MTHVTDLENGVLDKGIPIKWFSLNLKRTAKKKKMAQFDITSNNVPTCLIVLQIKILSFAYHTY